MINDVSGNPTPEALGASVNNGTYPSNATVAVKYDDEYDIDSDYYIRDPDEEDETDSAYAGDDWRPGSVYYAEVFNISAPDVDEDLGPQRRLRKP